MNGGEFLQTSHTTEAQHRQFSSPKRLVRVLTSVVQPAPGFLLVRIADDLHRSAIRTQLIRYLSQLSYPSRWSIVNLAGWGGHLILAPHLSCIWHQKLGRRTLLGSPAQYICSSSSGT